MDKEMKVMIAIAAVAAAIILTIVFVGLGGR
jgi:hypothetical protein